MSFEYLADPSGRPAWQGQLPGKPEPYVLRRGEGEHAEDDAEDRGFDVIGLPEGGPEEAGAPAALTRVAPAGSMIVNSSRGGGSKDTWLLGQDRYDADT